MKFDRNAFAAIVTILSQAAYLFGQSIKAFILPVLHWDIFTKDLLWVEVASEALIFRSNARLNCFKEGASDNPFRGKLFRDIKEVIANEA